MDDQEAKNAIQDALDEVKTDLANAVADTSILANRLLDWLRDKGYEIVRTDD